jgi:hypothetical protein
VIVCITMHNAFLAKARLLILLLTSPMTCIVSAQAGKLERRRTTTSLLAAQYTMRLQTSRIVGFVEKELENNKREGRVNEKQELIDTALPYSSWNGILEGRLPGERPILPGRYQLIKHKTRNCNALSIRKRQKLSIVSLTMRLDISRPQSGLLVGARRTL